MSLTWYIQRIKTFSPEEVFYRVQQRIRTHVLDKRLQGKSAAPLPLPESEIVADESLHFNYPIFEKSIDLFKPIDWHLDVQSGKRFPKSFAHKINIRSDEFGSAKHVWEVNRQLYLVHVASLYRKTGERRYLDLFAYHLTCWKNENPYLTGVNWYSNIEVNIRLINWYYCWQLLDVDRLQKSDSKVRNFVRDVWLPLIFDHAEFSYRHPSLYSSANNHLVAEYAGLFVAACKWNIPHRKSRLKYAQKGLEREILLQNSPDGVNREEAAEYIQFIDDFFLASAIVGDACEHPFSETYKGRLHQMARYLNVMLDENYNYPMYGDGDDGFLLRSDAGGHFNNFRSLLSSFAAYFKDSALKRSSNAWDEKCNLLLGDSGRAVFDSLPSAGDALLQENHFFKESGHFYFRKKDGEKETYLHFDAAPLGFLSIAAHGHADALSVILHVDGRPVLVDPGTFTYHTHKEWRKYFVGTVAHNTVRVDGENQARQAGPTMWLNHYKVNVLSEARDAVTATHNGYSKKGISHVRKVEYNRAADEFLITDTLTSAGPFAVEIPFHLHPLAVVELRGNVARIAVSGARSIEMEFDEKLDYEIVDGRESSNESPAILGFYSEHFGEKVPCHVLYAKRRCEGSVQFTTKVKIHND